MESHLPIFVITLILFVGVSASTVTLEMYWKNAFPDTPMPPVIRSSLPSLGKDETKDRFEVKIWIQSHAKITDNYIPTPVSRKDADDYLNKFGETFMLENKMIPGRIIEVRLRSDTDGKATFLARKVSDSIPFSSDKLPEIRNKFSVQPGSKESVAIALTLKNCEQQSKGQKLCATSLEAMVSFVKSMLGDSVRPISTTPVNNRAEKIKYKIRGVKKLVDYGSPDLVVCHKELYPYAVFKCHKGEMTAAFGVSLAEEGSGAHVEAAVVCHKDTSWWTPTHVALQLLHVKPGKTTPVCHFLDDLDLLWKKK